jgi:hypothetical protein
VTDSENAGTVIIDMEIEAALAAYSSLKLELEIFLDGIAKWFGQHPELTCSQPPLVHSVNVEIEGP